jgi:hypothetical protein
MANETNGAKYPTWAWLAATFLGIIMLLVGAGLANMTSTINSHASQLQGLEEKKVDKETYRADVADIKTNIGEMRKDVQALVWHMNKGAKK